MQPTPFTYQASDGQSLYVHHWESEEAKGIVQIAHGMSEHGGRYAHFARALNEAGYTVYANDHRGHGKTAESLSHLGHFADENGWNRVVEDMVEITNHIQEKNSLPLFLLGHSMGSFLARRYIADYGDNLQGVVLSGTGSDQGVLSAVGIWLVNGQRQVKGKRARSNLLNRLSFGQFNRAFRPVRTPFDWLSKDDKEVEKFIEDPLCGVIPTTQFFHDLLLGIKELNKPTLLQKVPKSLPLLLLSGAQDPVGKNTKDVQKTYEQYMQIGLHDVTLKLYPTGRHEMLNETNKEEVFQDIISWLDRHLSAGLSL